MLFPTLMLSLLQFLFGPKGGSTEAYLAHKDDNATRTIYEFTMDDIDGKPVNLGAYKGKVVVIINVASQCGLTPQYTGIESFYEHYREKGVEVLAFPANNFMGQEPGTDAEIKAFCSHNYGVTFPVFSKISVKGDDMAPLYQFLTRKDQNGVMDNSVRWNFQKYLIDRQGRFVTFFDPKVKVDDYAFIEAVTKLL